MTSLRELIEQPSTLTTSDGRYRVIDGDTLDVLGSDGQYQRIRLSGLDTPEIDNRHSGSPGTLGGEEAKGALYSFLESGGDQVRIEAGGQDRHGRTLGKVFAGNTDYGAWVMSHGLGAKAYDNTYSTSIRQQPVDPEQRDRARQTFRQAFELQSAVDALAPDPTLRVTGSEFEKGVHAGSTSLRAGIDALVGRDDWAKHWNAQQQFNPRTVDHVSDIRSVSDFRTWFARGLGEQIPGLAIDATMLIGGGGVGGLTGIGVRRGATTATLLGMQTQYATSIAADLVEEDDVEYGRRLSYSLGGGAVAGAINFAAAGRIVKDAAGALGIKNVQLFESEVMRVATRPWFQNRLAEVVTTGGMEAVTELFQEAVALTAKTLAVFGELPDNETLDEWFRTQGVEAMALGGAIGGSISGGAHTGGAGLDYLFAKLNHQRELGEAEVAAQTQQEMVNRREALTEPTTAERPEDIRVQFEDLQAGARDGVFLSTNNQVEIDTFSEQNPDLIRYDAADGTMFVREDASDEVKAAAQTQVTETDPGPVQSARAFILGIETPKTEIDPNAAQVIAMVDADGAIHHEELVNPDRLAARQESLQAEYPDLQPVVRTPQETQTQRSEAQPADPPMDTLSAERDAELQEQLEAEMAAELDQDQEVDSDPRTVADMLAQPEDARARQRALMDEVREQNLTDQQAAELRRQQEADMEGRETLQDEPTAQTEFEQGVEATLDTEGESFSDQVDQEIFAANDTQDSAEQDIAAMDRTEDGTDDPGFSVRAERVVDELEQATRQIARDFSRAKTPITDRDTAELISEQLRYQYPTVDIDIQEQKGRFQLVPRKKVYPSLEAVETALAEPEFQGDDLLFYRPQRTREGWQMEARSIPEAAAFDDTARSHLPRVFSQGALAHSRAAGPEYFSVRDIEGNEVAVGTKAITAWGRATDMDAEARLTQSGRAQAERVWFQEGLGNLALADYNWDMGSLNLDAKDISISGMTFDQQLKTVKNNRFNPRQAGVYQRDNSRHREQFMNTIMDNPSMFTEMEQFLSDDEVTEIRERFKKAVVDDPTLSNEMEDYLSASDWADVYHAIAKKETNEVNYYDGTVQGYLSAENIDTLAPPDQSGKQREVNNYRYEWRQAIKALKDVNKLMESSQNPELATRRLNLVKRIESLADLMTQYQNQWRLGQEDLNPIRKMEDGTFEPVPDAVPGYMPHSFASIGGTRINDRVTAFGETRINDSATAVWPTKSVAGVISAYQSFFKGGLPKLVTVIGDMDTSTPFGRLVNNRIARAKEAGREGMVLYDFGADFAVVWIDSNLSAVDQAAVMAHEIGHIYVDQALGFLQDAHPKKYASFMGKLRRAAGDQTPVEFFTNQVAGRVLHEAKTDPALFADPLVRPMVMMLRRWYGKLKSILGDLDPRVQKAIDRFKETGLFERVEAGVMSGYAGSGHRYFEATAARIRPPQLNKLFAAVSEAWNALAKGTKPIWATLDGRMRDISNELADRFSTRPGHFTHNDRDGLLQRRGSDARAWDSRLNRLQRKLGDKYEAAINEVFEAGNGADIDSLSPEAQEVAKYFRDFYLRYLKRHMPTLGEIKGLFAPTVYNPEAMMGRMEEFIRILQKYKDPSSPRGQHYTPARAKAIFNTITQQDGLHDPQLEAMLDERMHPGTTTAQSAMTRQITNKDLLAELRREGMIQTDGDLAARFYVWQMTKRASVERAFGEYRPTSLTRARGLDELNRLVNSTRNKALIDQVKRIMDQKNVSTRTKYREASELAQDYGYLQFEPTDDFNNPEVASWYSPTGGLQRMIQDIAVNDPAQAREAFDLVKAYLGRVGTDMSPSVRKWQSRMATYQAYTTLAFSTVASLPDLMGPILRMRRLDYMIPAMRDAFRAMVDWKTTLKKAEDFGLISERMDHVQILETYGMQYQDATSQKLSNALFKYNGQQAWTQMTRAVAFEVGKLSIERAAVEAAAGDKNAAAFLADVGVNRDDVDAWITIGKPDAVAWMGEDTVASPIGHVETERVHQALHRFVDESIVRPNAAVRPAWASDPRFMLLWQLKSFFYAYGKVVVKPFLEASYRQISQGNIAQGLAPYMVAVPGLLALSFLGMQLRDGIQKTLSSVLLFPAALFSDEVEEERRNLWSNSYFDNMGGGEYAWEMLRRTGVFGPMEMLLNLTDNRPLDSRVTGLLGPAPQQMTDIFKTAAGLVGDTVTYPFTDNGFETRVRPTVTRAIPGISQLPSFKSALPDF